MKNYHQKLKSTKQDQKQNHKKIPGDKKNPYISTGNKIKPRNIGNPNISLDTDEMF